MSFTPKQQHDEYKDEIDKQKSNGTTPIKKQFTPNIHNIKQRKRKDDLVTPEKILSPTQSIINNNSSSSNDNNNTKTPLPLVPPPTHISNSINNSNSNGEPITTPTKVVDIKPVILKIKRKIDDEPLPSIVIERPKKKAFLDTFKDLGLNKQEEQQQQQQQEEEKEKEEKQPIVVEPLVDKKRFTLISTFEESNVNTNHLQTKIQQRIEDLKNKSGVSSPKLLEAKKEKINKKRKESRYKQININRNAFSAEEKEFFSVHEVIELEKTTEEDSIMKKNLTKQEQELICNYKSMLVEHFNVEKKREEETKFVYDYYIFYPTHPHYDSAAAGFDEEETVILPPEDDFMDQLDAISEGGSSDDSENWYREYPSGEESYSEDDDEYERYHRNNSQDDFYEDYDDYDQQSYYYRDEDDD